MRLKVGDEVVILKGKDKGQKGKIEKIFAKEKVVIIPGINIFKKHVKKQGNRPAGIVDITKPVSIDNVSLICPKCNLKTKVAYQIINGEKQRVCKKCKQII